MAGADRVTVRYWAGARQAAGTAEETLPPGTLAAVLERAAASRDGGFARVLSISSFLVDEEPVGTRSPDEVVLPAGAVLDVLPPFAGG
jgi:molybdopterin converting factor small subunit